MKDKILFAAIGIVCSALLMLPAVTLGYYMGERTSMPSSQAQSTQGQIEPDSSKFEMPAGSASQILHPDGAITIPGFEHLELDATTDPQASPLYNPSENNCYFVVSLFLPSGEEIYRSGLIAPGEAGPAIALLKVPASGTYKNSVLRYSCYALDNMSVMNGADVNLTLQIM
ncbi:MAG: hypothetical protein KHZ05_13500 [Oscillospiraceae bacterium]|nr:hypothetical protein [Oscillospiraceae bacterium]